MKRCMHGLTLLAALGGLAACGKPAQPAADPAVDPPAAQADTDAAPPAATIESVVRANFRCGDLLVGAVFDNEADNVTLSLPGRSLELPRAISASGARYADTSGSEFWNKGNTAMFTLDGALQPDCVETDEVSPWDRARERGVAFRGLGNEPGWLVEVEGGDAPAMRAQLDYGERTLEVAAARPLEDGAGFTGATADGTEVTLRIAEGECSDGMSDQAYPASVRLQAGASAYRGCGAWLRD